MRKIQLYKTQVTFSLFIGIVGAIGTILLIVQLTLYDFGFGELSGAIYPVLLVQLYQYFSLKKYHLEFSKKKIRWQLATMYEAEEIQLSEPIKIEENWKGFKVIMPDKTVEVSLDGVWKNTRRKVLREFKGFYQ